MVKKNSTISIRFPDGDNKEFPAGITAAKIAEGISQNLNRHALAAKFNGRIIGLHDPINDNGEILILTFNDEEGRDVFWHSSAHLMAQAIKRIFPQAQLGIGPPIEDGFYYDIDLDRPITPEDFQAIETEMSKLVDADLKISRQELSREQAIELFKKMGENLKIDLISGIDEKLSTYSQGEFTDLCRGPHLPSTGRIGKNFKLLSVAGSYWHGDEKNKMLQRLYATAYPDANMLKDHLHRIEEAKKRDHRKLGRELDLFSIDDEVGGGLILWHPKGAVIRNMIESFWKEEHAKNGYQLVYTPHLALLHLWERSGHTGFYKENMYQPIEVEGIKYQIKPMNCPFHIMIYNSQLHSYRDLPLRYAELGTVYRYERSGVLHGLMRVRGFTQDDAHIYCTPQQLTEELIQVLKFNNYMLSTFGFKEYKVFLSTRPENSVGTTENWENATAALRQALENTGVSYQVDPGEGVFYGPKIDIKIKDVLGRMWQCSTIQVDFNLPEKFNIRYVGEDGGYHQPIMIHRALLGSLERFFGILIEHYAGGFPLWLAPLQVIILPITERHHERAREIDHQLLQDGIRCMVDLRNEKINLKIREAELQKIPYMLILGDKEIENGSVSVRRKGSGNLGSVVLAELKERIMNEIKSKN